MSRVVLRSRASMLGLVVLSLSLLVSSVTATTLGVDVFICSPTSITFTLLSTGACPGTIEGPGIAGTDCSFQPDDGTGVTPFALVTFIQIIEVDLNDLPAHVKNYEQNYTSGESIEWSSISDTNSTNPSDIPGGIQIILTGIDENGATIKNLIAIEYTNDGSVSPIFDIGDQIGWIVISDFTPPRPEYCPAVSLQPTTVAPESPPTESPVTPPSDSPAAPPSDAPIAPTSMAPVAAPTDAPEAPSSAAPVVEPSDAPEAPSSTAPVVAPSDAPEAPSSTAPFVPPSDAPVTPSPVLTLVPIAPVELETPSPTEMSMSFDYNWGHEKHEKSGGKKGGKKGVSKAATPSTPKDGKGKAPKSSTKGSKDKSPKVEKKNEKEGAKEKGDDDSEGSNKRLRRAAELQFFVV